jgi:hypothetical protein
MGWGYACGATTSGHVPVELTAGHLSWPGASKPGQHTILSWRPIPTQRRSQGHAAYFGKTDAAALIMRERSIGHPFLRVALPLAVFALLVCIDMPQIIVQGRFWAEEGTIFFENAWVMAPASALFTSYGGYLNLIANAATLAARWFVPLPMAPYVTIATGLVFQLCPPLLLLTARDAWLQKLPVRVAGLLLLLLVPASQEVWLQTLHCQFELLLCCAIILACDIATGWRAVLRLALLTLAPLTGVVCMTLGPLFLLRAIMDRSGARLVQTVALGVPALVQLVFFFHAVPGRGYALHGVLLLCAITIHHLALPFLGIDMANTIAAAIREALRTSHVPPLRLCCRSPWPSPCWRPPCGDRLPRQACGLYWRVR